MWLQKTNPTFFITRILPKKRRREGEKIEEIKPAPFKNKQIFALK